MKRLIFLFVFLSVAEVVASGQNMNVKDSIPSYFSEIKNAVAEKKDLWNIDLYGPILLVDPSNRKIYANYPDSAGVLKKEDKIFTGVLPVNINIANTSLSWGGTSWAMIMLPLPDNKSDRLDLLAHELFHRSQSQLGFHMSNADNPHLDMRDGRIYLRLELEALRQALISGSVPDRHEHLAAALFFRETRYSLFPGSVSSENKMELNEGLAEYTGVLMCGRNEEETIGYFEKRLREFQDFPSFVRSFAYLTTPLYGYILSETAKNWNKQITDTTNMTNFFTKSFDLSVPVMLCSECMSKYGFENILNEETKRESEKEKHIAEFKKTFIEQPHLDIKLEKMNISFDPRNLVPLEGFGTVYPTMRISDNWGILTVTGGALLASNWDRVTLSEPTIIKSDSVSGNGWKLEINNGYVVEKNVTGLNYILRKK